MLNKNRTMNEKEYQEIIRSQDKNYILDEGILYRKIKEQQVRIARDYELEGILFENHDSELAAHFGIKATYNRIKEKYYWKNMRKDIEEYVKSCWSCQMRGKPNVKNELHPIEIGEPFETIGIDIVGPLMTTKNRNRYIVVAVDYFTKWPEARAIKRATAEEVTKFLWEDIICRHGCPKKIISDQGSHFVNNLMEQLTNKYKINHQLSTPYHPETNGLVERFNRTLKESLAKLGGNAWDEHIQSVLFAYRTKRHDSTKVKPFYAVYGRKEMAPMDKDENKITMLQRVQYLVKEMPNIRETIRENVDKSQQNQKKYHDAKIKVEVIFKIGEKVLLFKAHKDKTHTGKLENNWMGPYWIHDDLGNGSYKLKTEDGKIFKKAQNGELLKRYYERNC